MNPKTDFGFKKIFGNKEVLIPYVNKEFTDKFRFLIIELAKFKKTLNESINMVDKLLYTLKHIEELTERPAEMEESLLKQLYEAARINKLSGEEMETYHQSVLDYNDVRLAVNYAQREGRKEGIEQERIRSVRTLYALNLDIDLIVKSTGFAE